MPRYLGIIPARSGSKRLPGKNLISLGGRPLLAYTFEAARAAARLSHVVVSTDSRQIADYALSQGVDPQELRASEISGDRSPVVAALKDALTKFERREAPVDGVVVLQPTSPLRVARHINEAISLFESTGAGNKNGSGHTQGAGSGRKPRAGTKRWQRSGRGERLGASSIRPMIHRSEEIGL